MVVGNTEILNKIYFWCAWADDPLVFYLEVGIFPDHQRKRILLAQFSLPAKPRRPPWISAGRRPQNTAPPVVRPEY